jgi:hypothetical protein
MQMRSCAWWLSVIAVFALTSSAWAAPKKGKKSKAASSADTAEAAEPVEPVEPAQPKDVDDLMKDSNKRKAERPTATADEPEPAAGNAEPDAWERPPAEEEKPKKKNKHEPPPEEKKGDGRNKNIGIMAGYGFSLGGGLSSVNPYSFGFGLQGDYELDSHMVLGVGGEFFIGETDNSAIDPVTRAPSPTYARYILGHALVGYNFWFGTNMYLRPSIWAGVAIGLKPADITGATTAWGVLLAPGLSFHYILGQKGWYIGVDARFSVPLGHETKSGLPILVTFGKRLD